MLQALPIGAKLAPPRGPLRPLSVAPMMDVTDRHFRLLLRQLTRRTLLYTEMIATGAILKGDRDRLLAFAEVERPLVLQLGGEDPAALAECARIAADLGHDEINLNVGCPSEKVREGRFGACLMARPDHVARCVEAMRAAVALPVTVKHRIGIDDRDAYEDLLAFVDSVAGAGCDRFIVHARAALLGLTPRENRAVPPLRPQDVHRLKRERPALRIEINGGIESLDQALEHLGHVDGVMIGRIARDLPAVLLDADARIFGEVSPHVRLEDAVIALLPHVEAWLSAGGRLHDITRHLLGLFAGRRGARAWRRLLSAEAGNATAGPELIHRALALVAG
jgi:tRNA-dihydrouridine synthase A